MRLHGAWLRGFARDLFDARLEHYAASLSWSTLFSIVPLLALAIAVLASLPLFEQLRAAAFHLLRDNLPLSDAALVLEHIDRFVANARELGWIGAAWMLLALYLFVRTYDYIVQDIAAAPERSMPRALALYSLLVLAKLALAAFVYAAQAQAAALLGDTPFSRFVQALLAFLLIWAIFWLFYQFSPNRPVAPSAAATSAFIAALAWEVCRRLFVLYIAVSPTYRTIYGSITTLIVFLLWIYVSWAIFIHGLKFCILLERGEEALER